MIKHRDMLKTITTGQPFNCTYCKKNGELTEFTGIKKFEKETEDSGNTAAAPVNQTRRRKASQYELLIPFQLENGKIRELYTRLIVKFNTEEVIL